MFTKRAACQFWKNDYILPTPCYNISFSFPVLYVDFRTLNNFRIIRNGKP